MKFVALKATKPLFFGGMIGVPNEREVFIMKQNITELVFILDRSGSMAGLEQDTIGGFNAMIEKQKKLDDPCYVSTFLFDHESKILHDRVELKEVKNMTQADYAVRGCTALFDAVGEAISHISDIHRYIRKEDVPQKTLFVITTDGMENSSHSYSREQIQQMIEAKKELGWEFIFLGANMDAVVTAGGLGIEKSRAVTYHSDSKGTKCLYRTVSDAVCSVRMGAPLPSSWSDNLKQDYEKRSKK